MAAHVPFLPATHSSVTHSFILALAWHACSEWAVNHHRDTNASAVGHYDVLSYFAVAENVSVARAKYTLLEKMLAPCGPPPAHKDE